MIIRKNASNILKWTGMKDASDGTYINNATVTWVLANSAGTSVATGSLTYVSGTNGNYTGEIPETDTDDLTENGKYKLKITVVTASLQGYREIPAFARTHTTPA